jgi:hypothetical protein
MGNSIMVGQSTDPDQENNILLIAVHETEKGCTIVCVEKDLSLDNVWQEILSYISKKNLAGIWISPITKPKVVSIDGGEGNRYYVTPLEKDDALTFQAGKPMTEETSD